jgi:hypothetical protein
VTEPTPESIFDNLIVSDATIADLDTNTDGNPPKRKTASEKARELLSKPQAGKGSSAPPKPSTRPRAEPASKPGEFVEPITDFYVLIGLAVAGYDDARGNRDHQCGMIIAETAPKVAEKWDELAQKNPAVRRALRNMLQVSAVGALIGAHVPIVIAISAAHGGPSIPFLPKPVQAEDEPAEYPPAAYDTTKNEARS